MRTLRVIFLWVVFLGIVYLLVNNFYKERSINLSFTEFLKYVDEGKVKSAVFNETQVQGELSDGRKFVVQLPFPDPELPKKLSEKGVNVTARVRINIFNFLIQVVPAFLFLLFFILMIRQLQSGPNQAFSFGKSRAKLVTPSKERITFKDVAGVDEAKEELKEVVEFLKHPDRYIKLGARIPKGVILVGPPGCGKTLLAKAVAGEANVPFFSISGSDFVEMFVGVGAARVRDLFDTAKKHSPCIIFIDEIDAVGRVRGAGIGGGHDEREQTLNALLVEMDGFETNQGIIVLAATNRPDILDYALLRPGRFDRRVVIDLPDVKGRYEILKVHTRKIPLSKDVDLEVIARTTPGFTGADIQNLTNEAALIAARKKKKKVTMEDIEEAKDKILMGVERKSMLLREDEKRLISYHEAGHTIVSFFTPHTDPIHKVTIIPRGFALGTTQQLPLDDRRTYSKDYLVAQLRTLMGGRSAEEVVFGTISTGAGNDIERATNIAKRMVCEWGMSEKLGPISFGYSDEEVFLGRDFAIRKEYSEETARIIDSEVMRFVNEAYEYAKKLIQDKIELLHKLADALLKNETLTGEEVKRILTDEKKN
uniref:ATP-dependent zinc metalloprotease FtsH n=1 Tax=candidate division WOR-3 bacterium TaxID=2052148 RepID=A0A7C4UBV3_UNCW3